MPFELLTRATNFVRAQVARFFHDITGVVIECNPGIAYRNLKGHTLARNVQTSVQPMTQGATTQTHTQTMTREIATQTDPVQVSSIMTTASVAVQVIPSTSVPESTVTPMNEESTFIPDYEDISLISFDMSICSSSSGGTKRKAPNPPTETPIIKQKKVQFQLHTHYPAEPITVIDAHCHLEAVFSKTHHKSLMEIANSTCCYKNSNFNLQTGINNCCFPTEEQDWIYTPDTDIEPFQHSFSVHPKACNTLSRLRFAHLMTKLDHYLQQPNVVALAEVGLDYSMPRVRTNLQQERCKQQMEMAIKHSKPITLHIREGTHQTASEDLFLLLQETVPRHYPIYWHCFLDTQLVPKPSITTDTVGQ